jgi:hypothetical protein
MNSYEHMRPTKPSKCAYPGDRYEHSRAIISISLLVVRRDRKNITDTGNHIIVRIEDDINYISSLSCRYESEILIWSR